MLNHQRHDVKIDEAIFRIEDLHVTTERSAALGQRSPIKPANAFVEPFSDDVYRLQSKPFAGRIVQISDPPIWIGHNDAFMDRIEDGFQKTFLLGQA